MAKADLHVHSKYSRHASEWFLKRLGAHESYTEPEEVYRIAKQRGMDYVALTDHNRIDGALHLKKKHPGDVIVGVEATAYFPEDGCKVHVLVYDVDEEHYREIERCRTSIYDLRDYIQKHDMAYAVAHATYSVNNRLKQEHLEKLILLFDVFEGINGARDQNSNLKWMEILENLTPHYIETLKQKHAIQPISADPWIKGYTAGSDDHAALFIGQTYTFAGAVGIDEFLRMIKLKLTVPKGRHNNYQSFAFAIYKIAYEFSRRKSSGFAGSWLGQINEMVFNNRAISMKHRIKLKLFAKNTNKEDVMKQSFRSLVEELKQETGENIEKKFTIVYKKISDILDNYFSRLFDSFRKDISKGDVFKIIRDIASLIPGIFLATPFFSSLKHLFRNRTLTETMLRAVMPERSNVNKRILWFTDTFTEMNGVAETIKQIGWRTHRHGINLSVVTVIEPHEALDGFPPNIMAVPGIYATPLPGYEKITVRVPSLLKTISMVYQAAPEEMYISTPGPVGLVGLLAGHLLNIKCTGIYHTDFAAQAKLITQEEDFSELIENYMQWFYSLMHCIKVPTSMYMDILEEKGYNPSKLSFYRKGVDTEKFSPGISPLESLRQIKGDILLYAGRISKDKNLDLLVEIYKIVVSQNRDCHLIFAGDGPYLNELKKKTAMLENVRYLGRLKREFLPAVYTAADCMIFPSTTDTFGMVVLEAQACGLPVVVSNVGGPQEIILHGKSGMIADVENINEWIQSITKILNMKHDCPEQYAMMCRKAREQVEKYYCWEHSLRDLFGDDVMRMATEPCHQVSTGVGIR
ncbi:glycosyltransferase [bacterium]|nr:glycosyltransferase [bacterium]